MFHWSPCGSLVSHEGGTFTEKYRNKFNYRIGPNGLNHQLLQLCTARIAWSYSDQAVRAVHSCNNWFTLVFHLDFEFSMCYSLKKDRKKNNFADVLGTIRVFKKCIKDKTNLVNKSTMFIYLMSPLLQNDPSFRIVNLLHGLCAFR